MDYESLIADLQKISQMNSISHYKRDVCAAAATALSTLQAENARLRADLEYEREHANAYNEECGQWEAENEQLRAELERMKKIMRDNGIMTIPPKYPGGPTEWNIPKPRSQKED